MNKIRDIDNNIINPPKDKFLDYSIYLQNSFIGDHIARLATNYCNKYHDTNNVTQIISQFADKYKIKPDSIEKCKNIDPLSCWKKFKTPNEFFIRKRTNLPNNNYNKNIVIVSPIDCYSIYFPNTANTHFWIKSIKFSIDKLIMKTIYNYSLFIFRLAPHHYHRIHSPVNGQIIRISKYGNKYYSVNPIITKSQINVYNENVRLVMEILLEDNNLIYLVLIGATCIGSIEIKIKNKLNIKDSDIIEPIELLNKNIFLNIAEEMGWFQFGGSTVALLCPNNYKTSNISNIIYKNTNENFETELKVGNILMEK